MRNITVIVCLFTIYTASLAQDRPFPRFSIEEQDWENESHSFPPGIYFESGLALGSAEMMLGYLFGKGIQVQEAWYKPEQSSCGMLQVIVPGWIIVKVDQNTADDDVMASIPMRKADRPGIGFCAHHVRHYVFQEED